MRLSLSTCTTTELRAWTGLTGPQIHRVVAQLWDVAPDRGRGGPWALPYADRVFLLVLAYRTNLTMQQLGSLFGISDSVAYRVIDRLAGPPPTDRRELWLVDRTLIPVHDHNLSTIEELPAPRERASRLPGP